MDAILNRFQWSSSNCILYTMKINHSSSFPLLKEFWRLVSSLKYFDYHLVCCCSNISQTWSQILIKVICFFTSYTDEDQNSCAVQSNWKNVVLSWEKIKKYIYCRFWLDSFFQAWHCGNSWNIIVCPSYKGPVWLKLFYLAFHATI